MKYTFPHILITVLLFFHSNGVKGQIVPIDPDGVISTQYAGTNTQDSIYVFTLTKEDSVFNESLNYFTKDQSATTVNWYYWNDTNLVFDLVFNEITDSVSVLNITKQGSYKVIALGATENDTSLIWVWVNRFGLQSFSINEQLNTCDRLVLSSNIDNPGFTYFDFRDTSTIVYKHPFDFTYVNDLNIPFTEGSGTLKDRNATAKLFLEKSSFPEKDIIISLNLTDDFGLELISVDTQFYETRYVKADYTESWDTIYWKEDIPLFIEGSEPKSAPYKIFFDPTDSKYAVKYHWEFDNNNPDTNYFESITVESTYYPNSADSAYNPKLTVTSRFGCTSEKTSEITIDLPSSDSSGTFYMPGIFVPFDYKQNYYRPTANSIRWMDFKVFNRNGSIVYHYEGTDNMNYWQGWDGTMKGNERSYVSPGVYYYAIRYVDYLHRDKRKNMKTQTGFFYVLYSKSDIR